MRRVNRAAGSKTSAAPRHPRRLAKHQRAVVEQIRRLHQAGEPLNITAVKRRHPVLLDAIYSMNPFWGWRSALEDARIPYPTNHEFAPTVKCELCGKRFRSLVFHLIHRHACTPEEYRIDYPGAAILCEETIALMMGRPTRLVLIPHWERIWTPEYVLDRAAELRRLGFDMCAASIELRDQVYSHAHDFFGSWDEVLRRIGLDPTAVRVLGPARKLDKKAILATIRSRRDRRLPLNLVAIRRGRHKDHPLWSAAIEHFGAWREALLAAGVDPKSTRPKPPTRFPTKAAVLAEIRRRHRCGQALSNSAIIMPGVGDKRLLVVARELFGSWGKAVAAAGLDYDRIRVRPRNPYQSKKAVVNEIRRRVASGMPLTAAGLRKGVSRDCSLLEAAIKRFGKLSLAVASASGSH